MADRVPIVVVDDSALFRCLIRDALREIPGASVIGNADSGAAAIEKIAELNPEVVTLDVEMPGMSGIDVLREMKRRSLRTRVIMVSRLTDAGAQVTTESLLEGAFDFVLKPSGPNPAENRQQLKLALADKIAAVLASRDDEPGPIRQAPSRPSRSDAPTRCDALLIGTSTGGPDALRRVLPLLPQDFPVPVLVVQHMPAQYTKSLATRLDSLCPLHVVEAEHRQRVEPGTIYIAPGGWHMQVARPDPDRVLINLTDDPPEHGSRPSVDVLFRSAVNVYGPRALGVILTGMGRDGAAGCAALKSAGGRVIAQHHEGCVVYGMPKAVVEAGLADFCLPLDRVSDAILRQTGRFS
ncbi:protein-glutamate methylesterase/protein-glutamine glutaminase [Planctomicrobium piriforme]|uniref:Protein-glutamate methylesterase/protein-glutamine glutaminase n=1 Tax=Planctomicrobium piriforme TaxID=1576369 RepID=A0A1I3CJN1_9PLAN|nr:chemotaxis response regulator protein-glutamate methylesterase [Planctomicrobium piriforme]SFH74697.1 two-component system, chemotaxis family, response regulator CheB [Planctomicrobium piriforme]